MEFKDVLHGDVVVVSLFGKIMGGESVTTCRGRLHDYLKSGKMRFVLDMGEVEWTNSQGLGMLIGCYVSVKRIGGDVVLARITNIRKLLQMTRLIEVFECFDSVDEAMEAVSKS